MNSGTPTSVALPDRSSFGITMSTRTRTVAYSCAVKNVGLKAAPGFAAARAVCACWCACAASASVQVKPAASGAEPSSRSMVRRSMVDIAWLNPSRAALVRDEMAGPHRERQDGPRAVLVRLRHERAAVGDEQVLHIVRLAVPVQHRRARVVPHARDAQLVDDPSAPLQAVVGGLGRHRRSRRPAHLLDEGAEGLLHVLRLLLLVVAPLEVETEDGDAELVHHPGIDLAVGVLVR